MPTPRLARFAWLSVAAALVTMGLKAAAWAVTGSVGLLSDALESSVNLVAAVVMLVALHVAARPPDHDHQYGHDKAELFSAATEGLMVVVAAVLVLWTAVDRLVHPRDLDDLGAGVAVGVLAALVNLATAIVLLRAGRRHRSLALGADGRHLLTDVWTSAGVVAGVGLVALTGWQVLDPLVALAVGLQIAVTGLRLVWQSGSGLMDPAFPRDEHDAVDAVLAAYEAEGVRFHALRTRVAGRRRFLSVHVLVPGAWTVQRGHALLERLEADLRAAVPHLGLSTHLEPVEDPSSYLDERLDR